MERNNTAMDDFFEADNEVEINNQIFGKDIDDIDFGDDFEEVDSYEDDDEFGLNDIDEYDYY